MACNYLTTIIPLSYHEAEGPLRDINHPVRWKNSPHFGRKQPTSLDPDLIAARLLPLKEKVASLSAGLRSPTKQ